MGDCPQINGGSSIGKIWGGDESDMIYQVAGLLEFQMYVPFGLGLYAGGGALCIKGKECNGMLQSGLRFYFPIK